MAISNKIKCDRIKEGVAFSEPVYFDDGENMFLAPYRPAKKYHLAAIKRWKVPFLITDGKEIDLEKYLAEQSAKASKTMNAAPKKAQSQMEEVSLSDFDELEELEELEEI